VADFHQIYDMAAKRKGSKDILESLLPAPGEYGELKTQTDDRVLSLMTKCIFRAGFVWRVIEQKWDGFEEAFLGFDPGALLFQPEEFWDDLGRDTRIVRNHAKILAVRDNAAFVTEIAEEHGSFAKFLDDWPANDLVGLWAFLGKRGKRLGGMTGRYFVRFIGKDAFIPSKDVVRCLQDSGLDIADSPTSKRDLTKIQERFNEWAEETGRSFTHLSRICAMSIGENYDAKTIRSMASVADE